MLKRASEGEDMKSEEIHDVDPQALNTHEWWREIAYQLALMNERAERREEPEPKHSPGHEDCPGCDENEASAASASHAVQEALRIYDCTDLNPIGAMTAALRTYSARLRETAQRVAIDKEYAPATRDQLCQNG